MRQHEARALAAAIMALWAAALGAMVCGVEPFRRTRGPGDPGPQAPLKLLIMNQ